MTWCFSATGSKTGCWVNWLHLKQIFFSSFSAPWCFLPLWQVNNVLITLYSRNASSNTSRFWLVCFSKQSREQGYYYAKYLIPLLSSCHPHSLTLKSPEQLAWIAWPYGWYQLLGAIFLEFQDVALNLAALVEEQERDLPAGHGGCWDSEKRRLADRMWAATPAAVAFAPQLLLRHLQSSVYILSWFHGDRLLNGVLSVWGSYEFTVLLLLRCLMSQRLLLRMESIRIRRVWHL